MVEAITLEINGDSKGAQNAVEGLSVKTVALGNIVATAVTKAFEMLGEAIKFAGEQMLKAIDASAEQEKNQMLLVNAMKQSGTFTREAYKNNLDLASSLQLVTKYGDEQIVMVQKELATFGVQGKQLKDLTQLTLDFASAKGMDLQSAGQLIAKTVGGETNALARYGIEVEGAAGSTERMTSATEGLSRLFGGTAQAEAKSFSGQIEQVKNQWDDLYETLGDLVTQNDLAKIAFDYVKKAIAELNAWVIKNKDDILIFVKTALLVTIDGFIFLIGTIKWVINALGFLGTGFMGLGSIVLKVVALIINGWELIFKTLTDIVSKIPIVGEAFKKVGETITSGFTFAREKVEGLANGFSAVANGIAAGTITIDSNLTILQDSLTGFKDAVEAAGNAAAAALAKINLEAAEKAAKLIAQQKALQAALEGIWNVGTGLIVSVSSNAANEMVKNNKTLGQALEISTKQYLGKLLEEQVDAKVKEISAFAITEIGKANLGGPLTFGLSLLAIPAILAAATLAKAMIRSAAGFAQGGVVGAEGNRIPLPTGGQLVEAHAGEVIGTPTRLAASGIGGITVSFNNYGAISSDVDIDAIGNRIADRIKEGLRGSI